ncbi:hypothetical protein Tco_1279670, partial [Tanacetum coccineum]
FDESNANVLERFYTSAGNPVKEILLKLNLPDHRILKDGGEVKEFQRSFRHSDTERLSRSDEVLKLKNFKKDATLKLSKSTNQECCFGCGGPLDGLLCRRCTCEWCGNNLRNGFCSFCTSRVGNSFVYNPNLNSFNAPPNVFNHTPQFQTYSCELCGNNSHYGFDCTLQGPHTNFQCQPWHQNYVEPNPSNSYCFDQPPQYSIDHRPQEDLNQQRMNDVHNKWNDMIESRNELLKTMQSVVEMFRQREQAESTIPLNEIISQLPPSIAITPVLPTMELDDSLIIGNDDLSTIPEKESDEVIKSRVKDLVLILSEFEDTFDNDSDCDLPFCDDSPPLDILGGNFVTFSNPLFDSNDDFTSSDDESFPEEDVLKKNFKIYSNPLFEFDEEYISSDVNPLFNEIDAFLDIDVSTDIKDDYHDSKGDIIYLECLLTNDTTHNLPLEIFLDHDPRSLKDEPDNDDLKSMVKVFDPGIHEKIISPTYVRLPFEDRHYFSLTFVIRIFLPYLTYSMDSSLLLSPGVISILTPASPVVFSFYSLEPVVSHRSGTFMCFNVYLNILNESPMEICSSTCFVPNITMIWGESS